MTIYTVFGKDDLNQMLNDELVRLRDKDGVDYVFCSEERFKEITDDWGEEAFERTDVDCEEEN